MYLLFLTSSYIDTSFTPNTSARNRPHDSPLPRLRRRIRSLHPRPPQRQTLRRSLSTRKHHPTSMRHFIQSIPPSRRRLHHPRHRLYQPPGRKLRYLRPTIKFHARLKRQRTEGAHVREHIYGRLHADFPRQHYRDVLYYAGFSRTTGCREYECHSR